MDTFSLDAVQMLQVCHAYGTLNKQRKQSKELRKVTHYFGQKLIYGMYSQGDACPHPWGSTIWARDFQLHLHLEFCQESLECTNTRLLPD